jgi:transposase
LPRTLLRQKLRILLTHRKLLQSKAIAIDNDLRGTLRNFGPQIGLVGASKFAAHIRKLVANLPDLAEPLPIVRRRFARGSAFFMITFWPSCVLTVCAGA